MLLYKCVYTIRYRYKTFSKNNTTHIVQLCVVFGFREVVHFISISVTNVPVADCIYLYSVCIYFWFCIPIKSKSVLLYVVR